MNLMSKRIQAHKSNSSGYFHFVCNQSDPDNVYSQITSDIGTAWNWTLYSKVPREGFKSHLTQSTAKDKLGQTGPNKLLQSNVKMMTYTPWLLASICGPSPLLHMHGSAFTTSSLNLLHPKPDVGRAYKTDERTWTSISS